MFGLFSQPQPTQTTHQRRDKMVEVSLARVQNAERMLDNALSHKQDTITSCINEETTDMADLIARAELAKDRIAHLQGMVSGEIVVPEETPVVE